MKEYYSVTEYASRVKKDPGNIRRMLINGRLKGEKIGSQWVISKDTEFPRDKRIRTGSFRNARIKQLICKENPYLMESLRIMSAQLKKIYGDALVRIVLYGSYARMKQTADSDVDIALFLNDDKSDAMRDEMTNVVVDHELDLGVTLSVITVDNNNFIEWHDVLPFYKNIEKEGIEIWRTK